MIGFRGVGSGGRCNAKSQEIRHCWSSRTEKDSRGAETHHHAPRVEHQMDELGIREEGKKSE